MDVLIRNVTAAQKEVLEEQAKDQGTTVSGLVKYWAQRFVEDKKREGTKK